jgi:hypothetical protein
MNKTTLSVSLLAFSIIIFSVLAFITGTQYARNQAVDACMKTVRVEWKNAQGSGQSFLEDWFNTCLSKKGY